MKKPTVLVVDDDPGIRSILCEILTVADFKVTAVEDGKSGLDLLASKKIELVLLDIGLPDINGIDLLQKIKAKYPAIEVVLVTGEIGVSSAVAAFDLGASGYVVKPFNSREMIFRLNDLWKKHILEKSLILEQEKLKKANDELTTAYDELKKTQSRIIHQEKMASIGQLAAGVAHEINNPVGFVTSNLASLGKYFNKLADYTKILEDALAQSSEPDAIARVQQEKKTLKISYVLDDGPDLVEESLEGTERVKKIVQNLKCFSRVDDNAQSEADINECLESTLNMVWNELKYTCEVTKDYGDIPRIKCFPNQLNQVFMNLLVNAGHAIEEKGDIHIKSCCVGDSIFIEISDNGCGISPEIRSKIFEPFFTTKEAGKGTGLGMSIAYDIVRKHNGELSFTSEVGKGSTFTVKLPVA